MTLQQYDHSSKTSMMIAPIDSPVWIGEILQGLIMNEQQHATNDCSEWESQVYPKRSPVIGYLFPRGKPQTYHTHIHKYIHICTIQNRLNRKHTHRITHTHNCICVYYVYFLLYKICFMYNSAHNYVIYTLHGRHPSSCINNE